MNQTMLAIGGLGTPEILVIAIVIFFVVRATRLPQLAKALGQSKKAFKDGLMKETEKHGKKRTSELNLTVDFLIASSVRNKSGLSAKQLFVRLSLLL